ncbi:MAG: hypothetical protein O2854_08595 [Chloroflexi bacterium]|nr:hypothetical protein [Chloroflexota bacterium]
MMDDIINMEDMAFVYEVTDALEIDREAIRVDLTKEDPGSVGRGYGGTFEIVLPLTPPLSAWRPILKAGLERLI